MRQMVPPSRDHETTFVQARGSTGVSPSMKIVYYGRETGIRHALRLAPPPKKFPVTLQSRELRVLYRAVLKRA